MRAILAFLLTATAAHAAPQCAPRDIVAASLATRYGETLQSMGLAQDGTLMEVWASPERGTWTLTVTLPNGVTCLVAAGRDYRAVKAGEPA